MSTRRQDDGPDPANPSRQQSGPAATGAVSDRVKRAGGLVVGTLFLFCGLSRRSVGEVVMAVVGAGVLARMLRSDTSRDRTRSARPADRSSKSGRAPASAVSRSVTIGEPADELYEARRHPEMLSRIMGHFAEVASTDGDRHRWTVGGPAGTELSRETRTVEAEPGEVVPWETTGDASVPNGGSVRFRPAPGDRGTLVALSLDSDPPGGTLGNAALERLNVVPETLAGHAPGRFESLAETGEIPTLEWNPSGRGEGGSAMRKTRQ